MTAPGDVALDFGRDVRPQPTTATTLLARIKAAAKALKREVTALVIATQDARTPWWWKLGNRSLRLRDKPQSDVEHRLAAAFVVIAYALSPIDLIPDFIPVLGYVDDLVLVPLGIWFLLKFVPEDVMRDARDKADGKAKGGLASTVVAVAIVALWIGSAAACGMYVWQWYYTT